MTPAFATRLLDWFAVHGRHDLPWQRPRSAYRVWVSEIMLQQTQVATVVGYFDRFMLVFPDLPALAQAPLDAVLAHWAGLGYYSRARNLQRAATICALEHGGQLPRSMQALCALPGIGRSTAAAILSQAHAERVAILDGNVKRVLSRHAGIQGYPGLPAIERQLWQEAEARLPVARDSARMPDYTQALMDLGASLCARSKPRCSQCPVRADCVAHREQRTAELPTRKPARTVPSKSVQLLIAINGEGRVLLHRRAPVGIWGGLWSLPELAPMTAIDASAPEANGEVAAPAGCLISGVDCGPLRALPVVQHRFTHFLLHIHTFIGAAEIVLDRASEISDLAWAAPAEMDRFGMPSPIRRLLDQHATCLWERLSREALAEQKLRGSAGPTKKFRS
ncbi:MAG: A/G-specific adenine glycosylase [Pseudomonadota bacterium]|nr:A/G-specific adenine glycosylase [Pseudomonadota bacterium]